MSCCFHIEPSERVVPAIMAVDVLRPWSAASTRLDAFGQLADGGARQAVKHGRGGRSGPA
jgi:hypothetical protein